MVSEKARRHQAAIFISVAFVFFALASAGTARGADALGANAAFSAGYRVDRLSWNIAGDTTGLNPNVLSELSWRELKIFDMRAVYRSELNAGFCFRGALGYGVIFSGKNQDSDYNGDNRTQEFSRSNNKADSGYVWDASAGFGYKFTRSFTNGTLEAIPMIGYAIYQQSLVITDGYQTIPPTGSFGGLNSSYTARWFGPWIGAEAAYKSGKLTFKGGLEYHMVDYSATADWNLRTDFQHPDSFDHSATGYGIVATGGADYALSKEWSINGNLDLRRFRASDGVDTTNFSNGSYALTKLNAVKWDSVGIMAGLKYSF